MINTAKNHFDYFIIIVSVDTTIVCITEININDMVGNNEQILNGSAL